MIPSNVERLLDHVSRTAATDVDAIRTAFRSGQCIVDSNPNSITPGHELLHIYRLRARHLAQYKTEHARTLRRDVELFCERLSRAGDVKCRFWTFELERGRSASFAVDVDTDELLGTLHTVDQRKVTSTEWATLWGNAETIGQ